MKILYTAHATATNGGRGGGHSATDNGKVSVNLSVPKEMGGDGGAGTNPEELSATGYAAFSLTMTVGRLSGDRLAERFGAVFMVRTGGLLVLLGILLVALSFIAPLAIAGFALVGAGTACLFPLAISAAARKPGLRPGAAIAAIATAGYTGFLLGPPLIGSIAHGFSLRLALALLAVFGVLIVAFSPALGQRD